MFESSLWKTADSALNVLGAVLLALLLLGCGSGGFGFGSGSSCTQEDIDRGRGIYAHASVDLELNGTPQTFTDGGTYWGTVPVKVIIHNLDAGYSVRLEEFLSVDAGGVTFLSVFERESERRVSGGEGLERLGARRTELAIIYEWSHNSFFNPLPQTPDLELTLNMAWMADSCFSRGGEERLVIPTNVQGYRAPRDGGVADGGVPDAGATCGAASCPTGCCEGAVCRPLAFTRCRALPTAGSACTVCSATASNVCRADGTCGCGANPPCANVLAPNCNAGTCGI